jgi:UDP-N-acetylglucosamine:LPS N-acetylglucosamine transferase
VKAQNPADVAVVLEELLYNKNKLRIMSEKAKSLSKPDSAVAIARLMLEIAK